MYLRARHYDPALGQFLQRDPIGFAAGDMNLYAYTWNDPHNWTDPSGLASAGYAGVIAGGASFGVVVANVVSGGLRLANTIQRFLNAIEVGQAIINAADANDDADGDSDGDSDSAGAGSAAGAGTDPGCEPDDTDCLNDNVSLEDRLRNKSYDEAEAYLDRELRDRLGWNKGPLKSKNPNQGVRYYDGRGNSVQINRGYSGGNHTGSSIKSGPYGKISGGADGVKRFPLK